MKANSSAANEVIYAISILLVDNCFVYCTVRTVYSFEGGASDKRERKKNISGVRASGETTPPCG